MTVDVEDEEPMAPAAAADEAPASDTPAADAPAADAAAAVAVAAAVAAAAAPALTAPAAAPAPPQWKPGMPTQVWTPTSPEELLAFATLGLFAALVAASNGVHLDFKP
jgi:hypothetical protein